MRSCPAVALLMVPCMNLQVAERALWMVRRQRFARPAPAVSLSLDVCRPETGLGRSLMS